MDSTLLDIIYIIASALVVLIPSLIRIIKTSKALRKARTREEALIAINDMKEQAKIFIEAAEIAYDDINKTLKAKGSSAGPVKKDSVMLKLQNYAAEKGYNFDFDFWSKTVDEEVAYTKNVNI